MKKRVGNDIKMDWTILRNEVAEDFTLATNIVITSYIPNTGDVITCAYTRLLNVFSIVIPASELTIGTYDFKITYNKPDTEIEGDLATWTLDYKAAFQIVKNTDLEDAEGSEITSDLNSAEVVQVTGQSESAVMSQKAVTDNLALKVDKVTGKALSTNDYDNTEKAAVANSVRKTGNETIAGVKTFSSSPLVPTPTADTQAAPKKYVDDADALKVDKVTGERLINAAEIVKLSNTSNTNTGDETQSTIKTKLGAATASVDGYLTKEDFSTFNDKPSKGYVDGKNYSVWNRGTVTYSQVTGVLTISNSCYLIFDNRLAVLQGGSGTNLITNFQVHPGSGSGIHVIYCDIPNTGSIGTINIISQLYTSVTALAIGFQRLVLGSAYWDTSVYYLSFSGIYEKDLKRLIDLNIANIAANALSTTVVNTRLSNIINGTALITGNDSTFSGAGNWLTALGSPTFDINSTVAGKLYMSFTSGNQCIKLLNKTVAGQSYVITITARLISGAGGGYVRIGAFSGSLTGGELRFKPTSTETIFTGTIVSVSTEVYLGCISTENDGSVYEFDDITLFVSAPELTLLKNRVTDLENETLCKGSTFFSDDFLQSLSKYDKPLTKIGICGDSLMANDIGGSIPVGYDEGTTKRPIRLTSNQISRRIYDLISWNKATHRRLDDADWTKSGTWTTIVTGLFEGGQDTYHTSIESGAYVEITVPSGKENFAFVCRRDAGLGVINITINGGDISSYGVSSVNLDRTRLTGADIGNPFHTVLYTGLPSGANVIRISKEANTEEVQIFGGFYWTGNTLVVHNVAHGGHNLTELLSSHLHLQADVVENDFDAILFQLPLMNEAGHGTGVSVAQTKLQTIISTIVNDKDVCFMGCQPFGTDPTDGTPNYYADYATPSMEDYNTGLKNILYLNNIPYVDVFTSFKKKIENRGGTLEGGEGGLWYTTDGQHQNEAGMLEYWNLIKFLFANKPIIY